MYLKNLTVFGFKSFADKTTLNFQPGVTAIVGPNGCGKSNVSDAIRWVLGEQSAKALRGGEMADVIFNGTDGRKPLGMAEVSLTIGGVDEEHLQGRRGGGCLQRSDGHPPGLPRWRQRIFHQQDSCRLKDIQQLFMGTGVGRTSYSIMAQGNITQILSSKPEDRRMIFEEAAGITKFKAQKKEALRKLEYTEQNLVARRRPDPRSETADRFACNARPAKRAVTSKSCRSCSISTRSWRAINSMSCRLKFANGRRTAEKLRDEIEIASAERAASRR